MRALLLGLFLIGCGEAAASGTTASRAQAIADCETNIDAGTPCSPCAGSPSEGQYELAGATFRFCDCPPDGYRNLSCGSNPGGTVLTCYPDGGPSIGVVTWQSCPRLDGQFPGSPPTTCATVQQHYRSACRLP